jgi:hypothetical protein
MEIAEKIYEPLIEVIGKRMTVIMNRLFTDYKAILEYFKDTQKYAFRTKEFKRDNIIHQIRVFLLGCYILYEDPKFWVKRIQEDFNKILCIREVNYRYTFRHILEAWAIASLFHDIGRPIEDAKEALEDYKNTYKLEKSRTFRDIFFYHICNECLFSWDNVPGADSESLLKFFMDDLDIGWAENAEISKSYDGKTIYISKDKNSAEIIINKEKEKAILKISDGKTHDLKVKKVDGQLNIYCNDNDGERHRFNEIPLLIKPDNSVVELFVDSIGLAMDDHTSKYIERKVRNLDHGAVGAILCFNREDPGAFVSSSHRLGRFSMALESLVAIALHDNCKFFFCSALTQLLIFCDELQEWNRVTMIGDREVMIFPCRKIFIKIGKKDDERVIRAVIPYERPKDMTAQEIFRRFEPMEKWGANGKKFEEATKMGTFQRNFRRGVGLEVHIITNSESFSDFTITLNGNSGLVAYRKTNIGDTILKEEGCY